MYSYGQFCKTPIGRMQVRKAKGIGCGCNKCRMKKYFSTCAMHNYDLFEFCINNLPEDAYLEKPSVGGKDHTSN